MKILIAAVGKIKQSSPESEIIEYYLKQTKFSVQIQEIDIPSCNEIEKQKTLESTKLLSLCSGYYTIALDQNGETLDSPQFAKLIGSLGLKGQSKVAFLIGGANGHSKELIKNTDKLLSLSKMTLPHKLARVFLVEQLYRAHTILSGMQYHK